LITFEDPECVKTCLNEKNHIILNRKVHCSLALSKKEARQIIADKSKRKLFVGGLSQKTTQETLFEHFSKFGAIDTAYLIYDKNSNNSRCFGFVEFVDYETAEYAHNFGNHILDSKQIITRFQILKKDKKTCFEDDQSCFENDNMNCTNNNGYYSDSSFYMNTVPYDPIGPNQQAFCPPYQDYFCQPTQSLPYQQPFYPYYEQSTSQYQQENFYTNDQYSCYDYGYDYQSQSNYSEYGYENSYYANNGDYQQQEQSKYSEYDNNSQYQPCYSIPQTQQTFEQYQEPGYAYYDTYAYQEYPKEQGYEFNPNTENKPALDSLIISNNKSKEGSNSTTDADREA